MNAVILAGGHGTRFWPWSRTQRPKQFLPITGDKPMLQETVDRLAPLIDLDRIFVVTGQSYLAVVKDILKDLPLPNIVVEPSGRNTAPAIGLAACLLHKRHPDSVMAVLPSDHTIENPEAFLRTLATAEDFAKQGSYLITIGITPRFAETGYGYIHYDREPYLADSKAHRVIHFHEKPNLETAHSYLASGDYLWNSGMFVARTSSMLAAYEQKLPGDYVLLRQIYEAVDTPDQVKVIEELFPRLTEISIDYGIMQEYRETLVIPAEFGWNDVGSYRALYDLYPKDANGNIVIGDLLTTGKESGLFVRSPFKPVAAIGIKDLVIVDTDDVLLVCHKDAAQDIKSIVEQLAAHERYDKLT